jgi:hypothetical protein
LAATKTFAGLEILLMRVFESAAGSARGLKIIFSVLCLVVVASNFWTMRKWHERTGVYDDLCYLRQAHLFQRFGFGGFDTRLSRDDDQYFATLAREIGYANWQDPTRAFCHTGETNVIQYPPGTGLLLSIFPQGFQRVPLYAAANIAVLLAALAAIWTAHSKRWVATSGVFSVAAIYFMVNPSKASFSMPPTMIVCAAVGFLTSVLMCARSQFHRTIAAAVAGLLLGFAVSFRLPNLFLSAGYFIVLLTLVFRARQANDVIRLVVFGATYLVGLIPTLISNTINAGSPLSTTYGPSDVVPRDFTFGIALQYLADLQGPLIILATGWAIWGLIARNAVASIVAVNLLVNLLFFLSHPIFTPYYLMPLAMLSLWSLLFSSDINSRLSAWRGAPA